MNTYKVDFGSTPWDSPAPGVRVKIHKLEARQLRLVEFSSEFVEHDWCRRGHIGYVLEGQLQIEFQGRQVTFGPGDGLFIPAGDDHRHKAKVLTGAVRLILVEDA
ncbi:MAG: cupin domain-containing protein [Desulfomonile tiedjei]|uniref:Cupin domain-containing protein n=1 Tax=Desulfomonile tiedjei TaxID=2358 RepID=A0A9D6V7P7_9BACT|nr:cupin domain-containing protein [Desulfomonile tiedjei]